MDNLSNKKNLSHSNQIDSILNLMDDFKNCNSQKKIDMTIGMYYDANGKCLLLDSTKEAELFNLRNEKSKAYTGVGGCEQFCQAVETIYYHNIFNQNNKFVKTINTPGGSAALRISFELVKKINSSAQFWVGTPTWNYYKNILEALDRKLLSYDYNVPDRTIFHSYIYNQLSSAKPGDVVILQGPCHNPTGVDYSVEEWTIMLKFLASRGITPIIDCAYVGFSNTLDADMTYIDIACKHLDNFILCTSFSKMFTIYNERVGAISIVSNSKKIAYALKEYICSIAFTLYFMPPHHGVTIVNTILRSEKLFTKWQNELVAIRKRLDNIRKYIDNRLRDHNNTLGVFSGKKGLFNLLPLSNMEILFLKEQKGIFISNSGRINLASLNFLNIDYFCDALENILLKRLLQN
jgi:aspartate/tyrosine/aromatic aminotransferase